MTDDYYQQFGFGASTPEPAAENPPPGAVAPNSPVAPPGAVPESVAPVDPEMTDPKMPAVGWQGRIDHQRRAYQAYNNPNEHARGPAPAEDRGRHRVVESDLVPVHKPAPKKGWRRAVHKVTGMNPGLSPAEEDWNNLLRRVERPLRGEFFTMMMSLKGGVGKSAMANCLGSALAAYRKEHVVGLDINTANGNLAKRADERTQNSFRTLITDPRMGSINDARWHMAKNNSSGLDILPQDDGDVLMTGQDLHEAWQRLRRYYSIGLADCGVQVRDDVTRQALQMADSVVVVATTRYDGAIKAEETLDWLDAHQYQDLVRSAIMLINDRDRDTANENVTKLVDKFKKRVRKVHTVPWDPHLAEGGVVDFKRLAAGTQRALIEAAASLVDLFGAAADKDYTGQPRAGLGRFDGEVGY